MSIDRQKKWGIGKSRSIIWISFCPSKHPILTVIIHVVYKTPMQYIRESFSYWVCYATCMVHTGQDKTKNGLVRKFLKLDYFSHFKYYPYHYFLEKYIKKGLNGNYEMIFWKFNSSNISITILRMLQLILWIYNLRVYQVKKS